MESKCEWPSCDCPGGRAECGRKAGQQATDHLLAPIRGQVDPIGALVGEQAVNVAVDAFNRACAEWRKAGDGRDEPMSRYAMRAVVGALAQQPAPAVAEGAELPINDAVPAPTETRPGNLFLWNWTAMQQYGRTCIAHDRAQQPAAVDLEAWLDRDWPLWRNNPDNPNVARLRRAWEAAQQGGGHE